MVQISQATNEFVCLDDARAGHKTYHEAGGTELISKLAGRLTDESLFLPLIFTTFKIRAKFIPFLDQKVKADCYYQMSNWHKGHTSSSDVLGIRSTQRP